MNVGAQEHAWEAFLGYIEAARPALDGCAPVALICLPIAEADQDGALQLRKDVGARIIWPASFPVEDRGPLLLRIAEPYEDGTVRR